MTARCHTCFGNKKVPGLGMIEKECVSCHGLGYLTPPEPKVETPKPTRNKKDKTDG